MLDIITILFNIVILALAISTIIICVYISYARLAHNKNKLSVIISINYTNIFLIFFNLVYIFLICKYLVNYFELWGSGAEAIGEYIDNNSYLQGYYLASMLAQIILNMYMLYFLVILQTKKE